LRNSGPVFFLALIHALTFLVQSVGSPRQFHLGEMVARLVANLEFGGFLLLLLGLLLLGFFGRKFFFKLFLRLMDKLFLRIPIIKTIYHLINEITKSVFSQDKKTFKQTVLLPFPNDNSHAIGFVTGPVPEAFKKASPTSDLSVFVPTSPQPISGFLLITPKQFAYPVDVSIEDAFKFLLSCGVMHPGETPPSEEKEKKG